ncbi:MAG: OmpA family protein [Pseudomonadota bacterium]|nr:OmpA family protein [Pseudomonadota bacterium]
MLFAPLLAPALAAGLPLDVELVRPTLAPDGTPGQDTPYTQPPGMPRFAAVIQAEQNPVVVYAAGDYAGAAVSSRTLVQAGARWGPLPRMDISLAVPFAWQEGGRFPGSAEGMALGDIELAARYRLLGSDKSALGVRVDLAMPTGDTSAWMGEGTFRPGAAVVGALAVGRITLLGEAGYRYGAASVTDLELVTGSSLVTNAAVRWSYERLGIGFGYLGRVRLAPDAGPRDHASALLASVQIKAPRGVVVDIGGGPGLGGGVGASSLRAFLGVAWTPEPPRFAVRPVSPGALTLAPPVEEVPDLVVRPPPAPPIDGWAEGELAKVEGDRIVIRDPIRFVFAKDEVLPESLPILEDVARVLAQNPRLAYIVVEGHASEEGTFEYNYALSTARARAIYRVLIEVGVHPDRVGYRAMGEVAPESLGLDEVALAANRRVVFRIEHQLSSEAPPPVWPPVPVPWTGKLPGVR